MKPCQSQIPKPQVDHTRRRFGENDACRKIRILGDDSDRQSPVPPRHNCILDKDLRVILSPRLKTYFPQPALEQNFLAYEGTLIRSPEMFTEPAPEFLAYHRSVIFKSC